MNSIKVDGISISFQNLLAKICFHHHFSGKQCHSDTSFITQVSQGLPAQGLDLPPLSAISAGPQLLAALEGTLPGIMSLMLPFVGSGGESRLLCLHVQPLDPGPPCLSAGEEGKLTAVDQAVFRERLSFPVPVHGCSPTIRPGPSTVPPPQLYQFLPLLCQNLQLHQAPT